MKKKPKAAVGDRYDVILTDGGDQKIEVARIVKEITGRHRSAAELTELFDCPTPIVEGVTEDEAEKIKIGSREPTARRRSRERATAGRLDPRRIGDDRPADVRRRFEQATILRPPARQDESHVSSSPVITRGANTVPAACDGEAKRTASAARTSKAPVAATTHRGVLFDGVSRPNRCGAAGLYRWTVGPTHEIVQTINASSGGAIHTVIPIQKRKLFFIAASASANGRSLPAFTSSCSDVFEISIVDLS